jgi:hypothetical protein
MSRQDDANQKGGSPLTLLDFLTVAAIAALAALPIVMGIALARTRSRIDAAQTRLDETQAALNNGSVAEHSATRTVEAGAGFHFTDALLLALILGALVYGALVIRDKSRARRFAREWEPRLRDEATTPRVLTGAALSSQDQAIQNAATLHHLVNRALVFVMVSGVLLIGWVTISTLVTDGLSFRVVALIGMTGLAIHSTRTIRKALTTSSRQDRQ